MRKQNTQTPSGSRFPGRSFAGERTPAVGAYQPGGISSYSDIIPNDGALKACHLHFQSKETKKKNKTLQMSDVWRRKGPRSPMLANCKKLPSDIKSISLGIIQPHTDINTCTPQCTHMHACTLAITSCLREQFSVYTFSDSLVHAQLPSESFNFP